MIRRRCVEFASAGRGFLCPCCRRKVTMSDPAVHPATRKSSPTSPTNHVRIVTAASLFDGHDAAINIMRRILQASGAEVIHLGHNRSVKEIVDCAIQEDAQGIAITSYQGGHVEYLKYMHDLVQRSGRGHQDLRRRRRHDPARGDRGAARLRHRPHLLARRRPRDGPAGHDQRGAAAVRFRGGAGADAGHRWPGTWPGWKSRDPRALGRLISLAENHPDQERDPDGRGPVPPAASCRAEGHSRAGHHRHRRARASPRWWTNWCGVSWPISTTRPWPSSRWIPRGGAAAAPCWATASA